MTQYVSRKPEAVKAILGRHLLALGYFAASSGNVTDDVIMQQHIATQDLKEQARNSDFKIGQ